MFALFVLTYTVIVLGLFALGAHVSRVGDRVLAALVERERRLAKCAILGSSRHGASVVVLRMRYVHELSYPEVAEVLDIPLGTVKSRIAYGIRVLRSRRTARG